MHKCEPILISNKIYNIFNYMNAMMRLFYYANMQNKPK